MKLIVYRDKSGKVQNIGEWDYIISIGDEGEEVINNPIPSDYTSKIEDVIENDDGSRSVKN